VLCAESCLKKIFRWRLDIFRPLDGWSQSVTSRSDSHVEMKKDAKCLEHWNHLQNQRDNTEIECEEMKGKACKNKAVYYRN